MVTTITGPGADDPFDPVDLDDIVARIVLPLVRSVVRPGDLTGVDLGWGPRTPILGHWSPESWSEPEVVHRSDHGPFSSSMTLRFLKDPDEQPTPLEDPDQLWLLIRAREATFHSPFWAGSEPGPYTMADPAGWLAEALEDWVCEDVYRGEQRVVHAVIPARNESWG